VDLTEAHASHAEHAGEAQVVLPLAEGAWRHLQHLGGLPEGPAERVGPAAEADDVAAEEVFLLTSRLLPGKAATGAAVQAWSLPTRPLPVTAMSLGRLRLTQLLKALHVFFFLPGRWRWADLGDRLPGWCVFFSGC